ncbi:TIR domain-containing protein [Caulobacter sp. SLTY]|uniref:toll/interleukin-1 receptor domain-containing protein n=1 Tax=Caulobacter sp. SLTY TaxID=2683262 RepID=UPI0014123CE7|nr:toll/interleukin-1 receptor domain-containing protein [Caulobacter sp. SLTY]NBB16013.1 TIR domain-containing protein [Caulobacter sp. SLTY]
MTGAGAVDGKRYRAFISYSHKDAAFANRLHRRLESYVLPKRLGSGRRLTPIFKDREELPAAHDLSTQVRAALAVSDCLIVACSPDAATSRWVGREIETFRAQYPDRPVLAALVRGDPTAAFPPALSEGGVEPLAADFRKRADGERLALLKLVAGMAGVGVDQLVQRDSQRQLRRVMAVTVASLTAMVAMGGMTAIALQARAEAERQRVEAEELVGFMLGDLRDRLEGVGRIPVLAAVNGRVLEYYHNQPLDRLPTTSLHLRAKLLQLMGKDEAQQGRLAVAEARFQEAYAATEALLEKAPHDPESVFSHGQSAYWRGYIEYSRNRTAQARAAWEDYRQIALELIRLQPRAARSMRELAYADGNLCTLALQQEREFVRANRLCQAAITGIRAALAIQPEDRGLKLDLATRWAWLAETQVAEGDFHAAGDSRLEQKKILAALIGRTPEDATLRDNWGVCHRGLSFIAYQQGNLGAARKYLLEARVTFRSLAALDPSNTRWRDQLAYADRALPIIESKLGQEILQ